MAARNQIRRYRMHARLDRGDVRLLTRTGLDWTHKYPPIAAAVASLANGNAQERRDLAHVRDTGNRAGNPVRRFCGFMRSTLSVVMARMR
jgi:hypothetical protein